MTKLSFSALVLGRGSNLFISRIIRPTVLAAGLTLPLAPVLAQSNPGYFIPPTGRPAQTSPQPQQRAAQPRPQPRPVQAPIQQPQQAPGAVAGAAPDEGPPLQLQLPPAPELPALAKATPPPAASIGVLGIPEIMRASSAAQQVEKTIGERREKLNEDAQKEQLVWREMQQALANERSKLSADQIRAREKELQDRITGAQRTFRDRNRIIQEAGQYGLAQIERMLVSVIRQVSESHGMNIVLHRAQVALNVNEFDITEQVVTQLNKTLATVALPA
ncbi:MAG: OmpH family outer membrane protein, partial [Alphaproteobacteria bacterium]